MQWKKKSLDIGSYLPIINKQRVSLVLPETVKAPRIVPTMTHDKPIKLMTAMKIRGKGQPLANIWGKSSGAKSDVRPFKASSTDVCAVSFIVDRFCSGHSSSLTKSCLKRHPTS
uniref:Uncharacterized protein n=1 Tax=Romanomermis culicivorax TaxID=13658 RepID=A0A915JM94_ROMCU